MVVVVERRLFGSVGEWIPAKIRRCWSVRIPFVVLRLVLTLSMVSVGSAFEGDNLPREGLGEDIVDGVRRFCHESDSLPREDLDEDLHLCSLSTSVVRLPGGRCCA